MDNRSNQVILRVTACSFFLFVCAEIVGAVASSSLSLLADAASMSIDVLTYLANMYAEDIKSRGEILSDHMHLIIHAGIPTFSLCALLSITVWIATDSIVIITHPPEDEDSVDIVMMYGFAAGNFIIDIATSLLFYYNMETALYTQQQLPPDLEDGQGQGLGQLEGDANVGGGLKGSQPVQLEMVSLSHHSSGDEDDGEGNDESKQLQVSNSSSVSNGSGGGSNDCDNPMQRGPQSSENIKHYGSSGNTNGKVRSVNHTSSNSGDEDDVQESDVVEVHLTAPMDHGCDPCNVASGKRSSSGSVGSGSGPGEAHACIRGGVTSPPPTPQCNVNMLSALSHVGADTLRTFAIFIGAAVASVGVNSAVADAWAALICSFTITVTIIPLCGEIHRTIQEYLVGPRRVVDAASMPYEALPSAPAGAALAAASAAGSGRGGGSSAGSSAATASAATNTSNCNAASRTQSILKPRSPSKAAETAVAAAAAAAGSVMVHAGRPMRLVPPPAAAAASSSVAGGGAGASEANNSSSNSNSGNRYRANSGNSSGSGTSMPVPTPQPDETV